MINTAAASKNVDLVHLLLKNTSGGLSQLQLFKMQERCHFEAFKEAVDSGDVEVVKLILEHLSPPSGQLQRARCNTIVRGDAKMLRLLNELQAPRCIDYLLFLKRPLMCDDVALLLEQGTYLIIRAIVC